MSDKSERNFFVPLLVTIVSGIIVALFVWWLNSEKYDLRYTLSEKIPLRFGEAPEEAVQQIEVKNLSKRPVEKVQIKLPPRLTTFEISKYSQADNVNHFKNEESEEFDYPYLPPQGYFRIVFKTTGTGVARSEVQVSHSKGEATYALETGQSPLVMGVIGYLCGFLGWMIFAFFTWRLGQIDWLNFSAEHQSEKILKKTIPFYLKHEQWAEIRRKAINNLVKSDYDWGKDIEDTGLYKLLDREKPEYLSNEEWDTAQSIAMERLRLVIDNRVKDSWVSEYAVLRYLRILRPTHFTPDKWKDLHANLQNEFLNKRGRRRYDDNLFEKLQEAKPDPIGQDKWIQSQLDIAEHLAAKLYDQSLMEESPLAYLKAQNLGVLPEEIADKLLKRTYRVQLNNVQNLITEENATAFLEKGKPAWMSEGDYLQFKKEAERTLKIAGIDTLDKLLKGILRKEPLPRKELELLDTESQEKLTKIDAEIRQANTLDRLLKAILRKEPLPKMDLELLDTELRQRLTKMDVEIRQVNEKNKFESEKLSEEAQQLAHDKKIILKQLSVLSNLFNDPSSIDRIEPYDNPFVAGNFTLLKKVSVVLQQK